LEVGFAAELVEGGFAAGEELAGVAVAVKVGVSFREDCTWFAVASGEMGGVCGDERWAEGVFGLPEDVSITVNLGGPFGLAAVALPIVGRHDDELRKRELLWSVVSTCFWCSMKEGGNAAEAQDINSFTGITS